MIQKKRNRNNVKSYLHAYGCGIIQVYKYMIHDPHSNILLMFTFYMFISLSSKPTKSKLGHFKTHTHTQTRSMQQHDNRDKTKIITQKHHTHTESWTHQKNINHES